MRRKNWITAYSLISTLDLFLPWALFCLFLSHFPHLFPVYVTIPHIHLKSLTPPLPSSPQPMTRLLFHWKIRAITKNIHVLLQCLSIHLHFFSSFPPMDDILAVLSKSNPFTGSLDSMISFLLKDLVPENLLSLLRWTVSTLY